MPPFYIGRSSVKNVQNGYRGSVSSKLYKQIWLEELEKNPQLFETRILTRHYTKQESAEREEKFHKKLQVHKNPLYINQATGAGTFFADIKGSKNPMFGKSRWGEANPFYGQKHTEETRVKMRGRKCSEENKQLYSRLKKGIADSAETKLKKSIAKKGKPPNSSKVLDSISKQKFICILDTKKEYTYVNACQRLPDLKHLFWTKKLG